MNLIDFNQGLIPPSTIWLSWIKSLCILFKWIRFLLMWMGLKWQMRWEFIILNRIKENKIDQLTSKLTCLQFLARSMASMALSTTLVNSFVPKPQEQMWLIIAKWLDGTTCCLYNVLMHFRSLNPPFPPTPPKSPSQLF